MKRSQTPPSWLGCTLLVGLLCGCSSTPKTGEGSKAWVQIDGHSRAAIQSATEQVFKDNGYELIRSVPELVFDKKATKMQNLAYGSWSAQGVYSRIKVSIESGRAGAFIVGCNPYVVRDRGDSVFEEEQRVHTLKKAPYQAFMDDVKKRLAP